jgi:hypothetical protein
MQHGAVADLVRPRGQVRFAAERGERAQRLLGRGLRQILEVGLPAAVERMHLAIHQGKDSTLEVARRPGHGGRRGHGSARQTAVAVSIQGAVGEGRLAHHPGL